MTFARKGSSGCSFDLSDLATGTACTALIDKLIRWFSGSIDRIFTSTWSPSRTIGIHARDAMMCQFTDMYESFHACFESYECAKVHDF